MRNITNIALPSHIKLEVPSVKDILGNLPTPTWLMEEAVDLNTSANPLYRLASLGLIARLWVPETHELRMRIMRSELPDPSNHIINWLRTVAQYDLASIALAAITVVDELGDEIDSMVHRPSSPEDVIDQAKTLVQSRDLLESAACLLGGARPAAALRTALKFLDNKVVAHMDQLPTPKQFLDTPKNRVVFLREPLSWWGYGEE